MNYLNLLDLEREPFSNSPDPDFFFASDQHMRAMQRLEVAIRLRKGLCVALGEVGTGKTTLCRRLLRRLGKKKDRVAVHLMLDPEFASPRDFLYAIADNFGFAGKIKKELPDRVIKEMIKHYLFTQGVARDKITVLIIDEGQKLPGFCLEILREFLNFETNQYKLLQIIIFAQLEFQAQLRERDNFSDRIAELSVLTPLSFRDTRRMILFRLRQAHGRMIAPKLFSYWALVMIYRQTGGYPRRIVQLCSQALLALIIYNKPKVTASMVRTIGKRLASRTPQRSFMRPVLAMLLLAAIFSWQWLQAGPNLGMDLGLKFKDMVSLAGNFSPVKAKLEMPRALPQVETTTAQVRLAKSEVNVQENDHAVRAQLFSKLIADPAIFPSGPVLGKIRIKKGDSLSRMMRRIYGDFSDELVALVRRANPQLVNINLIPVGTEILFPAVDLPHQCAAQDGYRLQLGQADDLAEADRLLKLFLLTQKDLQLVVLWQPEIGLHFQILSPIIYPDHQSVSIAMQRLPATLRKNAQLLHGWEERYLFVSACDARHM